MDTAEVWQAALASLEIDISPTNFKGWIKPTLLVGVREVDETRQIAQLACRTPYQQTMIEGRFYGQIKEALDRVTGKNNELAFVIQPESRGGDEPVGPLFDISVTSPHAAYEAAMGRVRLRPDYTFETFAVSSTNEMAHAAAAAVARHPGQAYHLLFFYGGVGVGKTHLMTAVGHEILRRDPETAMRWCSGEEFMNELVQAIQTKQTQAFRERYRKLKTLLVDDIQFIAGKDAVQEEFFHTFNAIVQNQGQIILTSDRLPQDMELLEDRLRSRFEGGLVIDIQEPNLELRTAILQIKAKAKGVELATDLAHRVAAEIEGTRKLEGFLSRLITENTLRKRAITPELIDALLGAAQVADRPRRYIPAQEVIEVVADYFGLKAQALKGKKRTKEVAYARHAAMFIMRVDLETPLNEIGRTMGGKDHTTVMHAEEKFKMLMESSEKSRVDIMGIRKRLFGG